MSTDVVKTLNLFIAAFGVMVCFLPSFAGAQDSDNAVLRGEHGLQAANQTEAHESIAELSSYLTEAALNNPQLEAAFNRWKASAQTLPQVKSLPDPRFTFAYFIRSIETRTGPQRARLGIAQTFPWFGKLDLKEDMAAKMAEANRAKYDLMRLKLFSEVKKTYYEYAYLAKAVEIARENLELLRYLESVVRTRYSAGAAPYVDVIKMHLSLGRLEDRVRSLEDRRRPLMARLNAAMNRDVTRTIAWPVDVPVMRVTMSDSELMDTLKRENPELRALTYLAEREGAAIALAHKDFFPDLTFDLQTIVTDEALNPDTPDSGEDPIIAGVSFNIPLWQGKRRAAVAEAEANRRAVVMDKNALEQQLLSDLQLMLYQYRDAERKIDLYQRTLLPEAEQAFNVTLEAFQSGSRTSLDLIDAEQTLLDLDLAYVRALADQAQRLADMERLVGEAIPCKVHGTRLIWPQLPEKHKELTTKPSVLQHMN